MADVAFYQLHVLEMAYCLTFYSNQELTKCLTLMQNQRGRSAADYVLHVSNPSLQDRAKAQVASGGSGQAAGVVRFLE